MYSIGAFLGGKAMAVFPNEFVYYEELYKYAIDLSNETGVFIEIRYFDSVAYKEAMECSRLAIKNIEEFEEFEELNQKVIEEASQIIEEIKNKFNDGTYGGQNSE
jgi:O-phosphoseryl-tRNA(Cys) synthetase